MIVGIGTDILDHGMTDKLKWIEKPDFLKRVFTENEFKIFIESRSQLFLYGRFAAKEAVLKCLGTGMVDGLAMTDIQIARGPNGQPSVDLLGQAKEIAKDKKISSWQISISHSDSTTIAFAIAQQL